MGEGGTRAGMPLLLHVGGWSAYALGKLVAFPLLPVDALWIAAKGALLSGAWSAWLGRARAPSLASGAGLAGLALQSLALAWISLAASRQLGELGWVMQAPGALRWLGAPRAWLLETLLFLGWAALFLALRHSLALRVERDRLRDALAQARSAREKMLRYQLDPHFLFNALASLRGLALDDPPRTRIALGDLAAYLRHTLAVGDHRDSSLAQEFDQLEHFLRIQALRYAPRIDWQFDLSPEAAAIRVPALLLQPLVENAIKHGLRSTDGDGVRIRASARRRGARCVLEVHDTGRWVVPRSHDACEAGLRGVGVDNVRQRLRELFGQAHAFELGAVSDGVLARIEFDAD